MHKISGLDAETLTGICSICGPVRVRKTTNGKKKSGEPKIRYRCMTVVKEIQDRYNQNRPRTPWSSHKKDHCEKCGFIAEHPCQLDVDHIDGDKSNNDPSNYMTLCANCHRLKTYLNKDGGWWSFNEARQNGS